MICNIQEILCQGHYGHTVTLTYVTRTNLRHKTIPVSTHIEHRDCSTCLPYFTTNLKVILKWDNLWRTIYKVKFSCAAVKSIWLRHFIGIVLIVTEWVYHWYNKLCSEVNLSSRFLVLLGITECVNVWYWDMKDQCLSSQAEIQIQTPSKTAIHHAGLMWTKQGLYCYCKSLY